MKRIMIRLLLVINMMMMCLSLHARYIVVKAGDATSLLNAVSEANKLNADSMSSRVFVFIPNGTYNLGRATLTCISGHNISIIGQDMEKTIITNSPNVADEGISKTATLLVTGSGAYFQDITLHNAMKYHLAGYAGRAVCLQDKGNRTICKRIRMLSYQDTYYSANKKGMFYLEDSEIHGTIDFICGGGDVLFNRCHIVVEKRNTDGSGLCYITAPYTETEWGYVFNHCTISNDAAEYSLGRAWGGHSKCAFLNTTLNDTARLIPTRWTTKGMNVYAYRFVEYNSMDASGHKVTPSENILTFYKNENEKTYNTIINEVEAKQFSADNMYGNWHPVQLAAQIKMPMWKRNGNVLKWQRVKGAAALLVTHNGEFETILEGNATSYKLPAKATGEYDIRVANIMGGFGINE